MANTATTRRRARRIDSARRRSGGPDGQGPSSRSWRAGGRSRIVVRVAELEGRVAVITGGGSGIGAATARRFAAEGARVAVLDRDADAAAAVASEVGGKEHPVDVRDGDAVNDAVARIVAGVGRIDVLVNNAGI